MVLSKYQRQSMTNALRSVLPYPRKWFDGLADKQLNAIYKQNWSKIVNNALMRDEMETRRRAGLEPRQSEQLKLFI